MGSTSDSVDDGLPFASNADSLHNLLRISFRLGEGMLSPASLVDAILEELQQPDGGSPARKGDSAADIVDLLDHVISSGCWRGDGPGQPLFESCLRRTMDLVCMPRLKALRGGLDRDSLRFAVRLSGLLSTCLTRCADASRWRSVMATLRESFLFYAKERPNVGDALPPHRGSDILSVEVSLEVVKGLLGGSDAVRKELVGSVFPAVLEILEHSDDGLAARIVSTVLAKLLLFEEGGLSPQILELWKIIAGIHAGGKRLPREGYSDKPLLLLCGLAGFFFPADGVCGHGVDPRARGEFWEILQCGMMQDNSVARKRALYLLKRIVDTCERTSANFSCVNDSSGGGDAVFWWCTDKRDRLSKVWQDFIILMETLEENQVHVIKPLLPKLVHLTNASSRKEGCLLHTSWLTVIIGRSLIHESIHIIRWAVHSVLDVDFKSCPMLEQDQDSFLCGRFLNGLQKVKLYLRETGSCVGSCPKVGVGLIYFFRSCWEALPNPLKQAQFFNNILLTLSSENWSPVPVLFICQALARLPPSPLWDGQSLKIIRDIVSLNLSTMAGYLRGAVQGFLAEALVNLLDTKAVSPMDWSFCLSVFTSGECLARGTRLWSHYVNWLQVCSKNSKSHSAWLPANIAKHLLTSLLHFLQTAPGTSFEQDNGEAVKLARVVLLSADAQVLPITAADSAVISMEKLLLHAVDVLSSVNSHAYLPATKADRALLFLSALLSEHRKEYDAEPGRLLKNIVVSCAAEVFFYIGTRIRDNIRQMGDVYILDLYTSVIPVLCSTGQWLRMESAICGLVRTCFKMLTDLTLAQEVSLELQMKKVAATCVLGSISKTFVSDPGHQTSQALALLDNYVEHLKQNSGLFKPKSKCRSSEGDESSLKSWGWMASKFMASHWWCVRYLLVRSGHDVCKGEWLLHQGMDALYLVSRECTLVILDCLRYIIAYQATVCNQYESLLKVLKMAWSQVEEDHKCATYWQEMEAFVALAYQVPLLKLPRESEVIKYLQQNSRLILTMGEARSNMANLLVRQLCKVWHTSGISLDLAENFLDVVLEASMYGSVHKKDERSRLDVLAYIASLKETCSVNELMADISCLDSVVRVMVINFLSILRPGNPSHHSFVRSLLSAITKKHLAIAKTQVYRHFCNSLYHRQKHRLTQTFLLLEPFITEANIEELWMCVWELLYIESQPSVRFMVEWLAVRLAARFPTMICSLWQQFTCIKSSENRHMSICSLLFILSHLGPHLTEKQSEFYVTAIPLVLPWCWAQHFNTRIYAQATLATLWQQGKELGLTTVADKFALVEKCLQFTDDSVSANMHKLLQHYSFATFDCMADYSIETIFHTIPRLTWLNEEEWIQHSLFSSFDESWYTDPTSHHLPLTNQNDRLSNSQPGQWRSKNYLPTENEEEHKCGQGDFQKKIIPWKLMAPDPEVQAEQEYRQKCTHPGQLVMVTTLIDKVPNLGGLCRTSEIFGVAEFVMGNLKHISDKNFQALSVTSEKWVPIKEVRLGHLKEFLLAKQQNGYTLVGAEQTAKSISLTEYKFPEKTVLILGNEKEGIPADLIQLLDVCVEIPQQGVIRSLNVHVSGALLVWEYTRQQLMKSDT